jgi:hypothetical protein
MDWMIKPNIAILDQILSLIINQPSIQDNLSNHYNQTDQAYYDNQVMFTE